MTPEQAVLERILAIAAVTALVSTRVYMLKVRQGSAMPAIRVQRISGVNDYHQRGEIGLKRSRVQVDVYAGEASGGDPYASALNLAALVHGDGNGVNASGLSGWIGTTSGSPSIRILGVFLVDQAVGYEADEIREVRVRQDYMVHWKA